MAKLDVAALSERIKRGREEQGLSQEELAERAELSPQHISRLECGQKVPRLETLVSIAEALDTSPDYLIYGRPVSDIEINELLADCSEPERCIILETAQALKKALHKYG